ncbi:MAG: (2Fe-2S) ferredoxin domain-containing protein [Spirochaetes bacterium]|nr:(2Fe-2S) ferredoxin domain-containing protein [Spirochaetota bacterium]
MEKPDFHFFVCNSFRVGGEPQGICNKRGAADLIQYLEGELADRGMSSLVTSAGCLKVCDRGPAMVVYPKGDWYGNLSEEAIDEILDAMEESSVAEKYLLT